jgi:diaminohydroxyphosphoribosylaminopyrimidine deaminase / 5-amino-6-(5-phosphoribosylamino)uracil reductase
LSEKPQTPDERFMAEALEAGQNGHPSPNPHVGAVVVSAGGETVGVGHHEVAGADHAEVAALKAAGDRARGGTLYVTLEPCNHHGRTPPCVEAIVRAGIVRVVIGCRDPNPQVTGGGIEALRKAGIHVEAGILEGRAEELLAPWAKYVTTGLPFVRLKLALSLDGRIATRTGASRWVTGPEARARVHLLRSQCDAVLVGVGTVIADDPRLNVRHVEGPSPKRVVLDTKLRTPLHARLVETAQEIPTWIICSHHASAETREALEARGVRVWPVEENASGRVDVSKALRLLASRGIVTLLVEGGSEVAGSFLAGELADELHAFLAPKLLGPRGRAGAVDWCGPAEPSEAPQLVNPTWELCGRDAYVHGRIAHGHPETIPPTRA